MKPIENLENIGINLPIPPKPVGSYVPGVKFKNQIFISGQLPLRNGTLMFPGTLGLNLSVEQGASAARQCAVNALSILNELNNGLDNLYITKLTGYVCSIDSFKDHPAVLNGASNFFENIFEDHGKHARSVVGVNSLPLGAAIELELIATLD
jgi:enamine deaminase RidA (YjgF/YER057c/UK114 family)